MCSSIVLRQFIAMKCFLGTLSKFFSVVKVCGRMCCHLLAKWSTTYLSTVLQYMKDVGKLLVGSSQVGSQ